MKEKVRGRHVLFGKKVIEESKNKKMIIVEMISRICETAEKKVVPISDSVRFTMKKSPSFSVKQRKSRMYYCFGCGAGGKCIYNF